MWEKIYKPGERFAPNKNAEELGIDTTRTFVVLEKNFNFETGEKITLKKDDGSSNPFFWYEDKSTYDCISWCRLAYAEDETVSPPLKFKVGDLVEEVSSGRIGIILSVSKLDSIMPYRVKFGDSIEWLSENSIELALENTKISKFKVGDVEIVKLSSSYDIKKGDYSIIVKKYESEDGKLSITPNRCDYTGYDKEKFLFKNSKPETVRAIGEMLIAASKI